MKKISLGIIIIIGIITALMFLGEEQEAHFLTGMPLSSAHSMCRANNACCQTLRGKHDLSHQTFQSFTLLSPEEKRKILTQNCNELKELVTLRTKKVTKKRNRSKKHTTPKINILIIGNGGGGGHKAAGDAITQILRELPGGQNLFEVVYTEPFMKFFDNLWNKALQAENGKRLAWLSGQKGILDTWLNVFPLSSILKHKVKSAMRYPDVIIVAQPVGPVRFKKIAQSLGAQVRFIPTDLYVNHFIEGIKNINANDFRCAVDIMGGIPELAHTLKDKNIFNYFPVGYPTRPVILNLAENLYHSDKKIRAQTEREIGSFLKKQRGFCVKNGIIQENISYQDGDNHIFIMIGGKGTLQSRIIRYTNIIAEHAEEFAHKNHMVHLFIALSESYTQALKDELIAVYKKLGKDPQVVIHSLAKVPAQEVGMLMASGITLSKAGGSTIAELLTLKSPVVFDMNISKHIVWEKFAADLFEKKKWGIQLKDSNDGKEVSQALKKAFLMRDECIKTMPSNQFHLDWPKALMDDLSLFLCDQLAR